jgi:hypothetical protein
MGLMEVERCRLVREAWVYAILFGTALIPSYGQPATDLAADIAAIGPDKAYDLSANWILEQDPRLRAWAAELIAKYEFTGLYPRLLTALGELEANASEKFAGTTDEFALEAVADALIKTDVAVPSYEARQLYPKFPALAMIFLSRSPDDNHAALLSILNEAKAGEVWLASANLLATNPSPEFVIQLLDDFQIFVRILVFRPGTGGGMSYGDCYNMPDPTAGVRIPEGWPPISIYSLQLAKNAGGTVIASGIDAVSFTSRVTNDPNPWHGNTTCGGPDIQELRRDLIVQLAGIDDAGTALRTPVLSNITRETDDQYRKEATAILAEQAQSFTGVLKQLQLRGLITPAQAAERLLHMRVIIVQNGLTLPPLADLRSLGIDGQYQLSQ